MEKQEELHKRLTSLLKKVNLTKKAEELKSLEADTYNPEFWQDREKSTEVMKKISYLKKEIEDIEMIQLLLEEKNYHEAEKMINKYEIDTFLSAPYDEGDTIFAIHAGQGGTEAMDWVKILLRMYTRYFERKNWKYEEINNVAGDEAGIKSVTLNVHGPYTYGYLKSEAGTHRLVRQSPFNADKLRQTSFALVEVLPVIKDQDIALKDEDLEWQFFRSGGKGGQNVNKVSTAVRLTHKLTQITVTCQTERSQGQNRENALKLLRAKLWQIEEEKKEKTISGLKKNRMASWGTQIRSYVLHPYKLIKDLRTDYEETNVNKVLDGDLDSFIEEFLRQVDE